MHSIFAIELCLACWSYDWTGDKEINERDVHMLEIEFDAQGNELPEGDPRRRPTFRIDHGDVPWARASIAFQRSILHMAAAYQWSALARMKDGDPKLLRTAWLVFLAAKQYDLAATTGAELIKADTAAADTTYFIRTAGAYAAQSNWQKAADALAQGEAKFPNNATLYLNDASALSKAGNNQAALVKAQKAISLNPKIENGCAQVALIQSAMGQTDAVITTVRSCATNGADKHTLAQVLLAEGNKLYKAGNASKDRPTLQKAIDVLKSSDQLEASSDAKFLIGVSAFTIGQSAITEAQGSKSCALARMAKENFALSQENVPAGLQSYPDAAKQVLTAIPQFTPATDEMVKRFCK